MRQLPDQLRRLLTGTPPSRIGFGPGPLTDLRVAGHAAGRALRTRPLRLCLLEHDTSTMFLAEPTAFWINRRSRVCWAERNGPVERADLVWVFTQDPLTPEVRSWLDAQLRRVRPGVRVLNPPAVYDAYHDPECFPRLARAGVRVPRTAFDAADVGVTPVVYKAVGAHAAHKERCPYDGPRPGYRAAVAHDSRGPDGRYRRYRAFVLGDLVLPEDVIVADHWNASGRHLVAVERNFTPTGFERTQLRLLTTTLGLDFACVDYLRERDGGAPVFHDVNVYPTVVGAWQGDMPAGDHGRWHVFDTCDRLGLPPPGGRPVWRQFDDALVRLARGPRDRPRGSPIGQRVTRSKSEGEAKETTVGLLSHGIAVGIGYLLGSPQGRQHVNGLGRQAAEVGRRPEVARLRERGLAVVVEQAQAVRQKVAAKAGGAADAGGGTATPRDTAGRSRRTLRLPARLRRRSNVHFPESSGIEPPTALGGTTVVEDSEAALLGAPVAPRADPPAKAGD